MSIPFNVQTSATEFENSHLLRFVATASIATNRDGRMTQDVECLRGIEIRYNPASDIFMVTVFHVQKSANTYYAGEKTIKWKMKVSDRHPAAVRLRKEPSGGLEFMTLAFQGDTLGIIEVYEDSDKPLLKYFNPPWPMDYNMTTALDYIRLGLPGKHESLPLLSMPTRELKFSTAPQIAASVGGNDVSNYETELLQSDGVCRIGPGYLQKLIFSISEPGSSPQDILALLRKMNLAWKDEALRKKLTQQMDTIP